MDKRKVIYREITVYCIIFGHISKDKYLVDSHFKYHSILNHGILILYKYHGFIRFKLEGRVQQLTTLEEAKHLTNLPFKYRFPGLHFERFKAQK